MTSRVCYTRVMVAGHTASGKSTFASLLAKELETEVLNTGDALREALSERGIVIGDRLNTGSVFLREFGEDGASKAVLDCARSRGALVVEGLRLFSMYKRFLDAGENVLLVFLSTTEDVRLQRFGDRQTGDGSNGSDAARTLAAKDAYYCEVERLREAANIVFDNSGSIERLTQFALEVSDRFRSSSTDRPTNDVQRVHQ